MPQDTTTLQWIPVATLGDLWEGDMTDVEAGDEIILLVHLAGGDIRAYQGHCPHQQTNLAGGKLDGHILTCAAHLWQFDLSTGQGVNPKRCQLHRYQVKVEDATIFVGIPYAVGEEKGDGNSSVAKVRRSGASRHGPRHHRSNLDSY